MKARLRKLAADLGETFWLIPALMVVAGIVLAIELVGIDRSGVVPGWLISTPWLYGGGSQGARTLLGAVMSSTINVAGTIFSITIAGLSLAAGQMGPRLLRNFTRDRGNQMALGAFLGTFSYALMVLRTVRTQDEGDFVPHLALSVGILLAFICVGTLVFFVGHMAGRINVDTVIELVGADMHAAINRFTTDEEQHAPPPLAHWQDAVPVVDTRRGYLQNLDQEGLADWAADHRTALRLLVRPGEYIFPGAPVAVITPAVEGADKAFRDATALGRTRASDEDLEYAVRQLVEVAVRALSPGINDPHTAMAALDRLGAAMCDVAGCRLPSGVSLRDGQVVLVVPAVDYDGLADAMFHLIRQSAATSAAVLMRMLEVLTAIASCERDPARVQALRRHAELVRVDAERGIANPADLTDLRRRHARFEAVWERGATGYISPAPG